MIVDPHKGTGESGCAIGVPARTRLFEVPPLGVGTWRVESLASYFGRLARAHGTNAHALAHRVVRPHLESKSVAFGVKPWADPSFSSFTPVTHAWVSALESLTPCDHLHHLTLIPLEGRVSYRGLMSKGRRWCPLCIGRDQDCGESYGYLIWELATVTACPDHGVQLSRACPCGLLGRRSHPVESWTESCPKCGHEFRNYGKRAPELANPDQLSRAAQIKALFDCHRFKSNSFLPTSDGLCTFLKEAAIHLPDGGYSKLAHRLGIQKGELYEWAFGWHVPGLPNLAVLAEAFGVTLADLLSGEAAPDPPKIRMLAKRIRPSKSSPQERRVLVGTKLMALLEVERLEAPAPSLTRLSKTLGVDRRTLWIWFEKFVAALLEIRDEERKTRVEVRRAARIGEFWRIATQLAEKGTLPTRNRIGELIQGGAVYSAEEKAACDAICQEVRRDFRMPDDDER